MSGNPWGQPGVSHKGWHCVDVVDLRAGGESADETDYTTCQMCGDYEEPKRREAKWCNRAARRTRWLQRKWRVSAKGDGFLNVDSHNLAVHMNKFKRWGYRIGSRFSTKTYAKKEEARLALFDDFWAATQDDEWLVGFALIPAVSQTTRRPEHIKQ